MAANKLTRRQALAGLGAVGGLTMTATDDSKAIAQPTPRAPDEKMPINGKAGPGLEDFDAAMISIMERHGIPGAAFAVARQGKLILAKGYGWADLAKNEPVRPDTLFGLASLSKPITAVATLKLVEQKKLGLDDKVHEHIKHIKPIVASKVDRRFRDITVRQCLNHSGGWDRAKRGDSINWEPQICRALGVRPPVSTHQFISFAMCTPIDYAPGTDAIYSNIGYILLGEVIARVSGQSYDRYVREQILKPMGISRLSLNGADGKYLVSEAIRYLSGSLIPLPPLLLPMVNAAGGWIASAVDMLRFLTNLDGSRGESVLSEQTRKLMIEAPPQPLKPRANGTWFGLGWDAVAVNDTGYACFKDGSCQGMRTFMKRLPGGINWALLYNASMEFDPQDMQTASGVVHEIRQLVESFAKYPDIDLFGEYR